MTNRDGGDNVLGLAAAHQKIVTVVPLGHAVRLHLLPQGDFASTVIAACLVVNVVIPQQPHRADAQSKGQHIGLAVQFQQAAQLRGSAFPSFTRRRKKCCNTFQKRVWRFLPKLRFNALQLPYQSFGILVQV